MMTKYEEPQEHLRLNQYTWLVTGIVGFIGSNLLEKLLKLNQKVVGLDNFETGHQHNIDQAMEDAAARNIDNQHFNADNPTFIEGDIRDLETCHRTCKGVDYVLHQAALGSAIPDLSKTLYEPTEPILMAS